MIKVISKIDEASVAEPKDTTTEEQKPEESQKSEESQSSEEKKEFEVGQIVKYKTKEGGEAEGEIKKVDDKELTIYNKNVNQTFKKPIDDIVKENYKTTILSYKQFISK
jgi:hypothetical protein